LDDVWRPNLRDALSQSDFLFLRSLMAMSTLQATAQAQLRQFIEQIERLEEEKKALASDLKDKYLEAKAVGFDVKTLRKIVQLRKKSETERQEEEGLLEVYLHALGMLNEAPAINDDATLTDNGETLIAAE